MSRVFVDSSVLFAGIASRTGHAHDLLRGGRPNLSLICSNTVLGEVERNLRTKYPATSTDFSTLVESGWLQAIDPPESLIIECAQLVHSKDATIVAAAVHSESEWLATYDQRHLLSRRTAILARYNITTARPDEILESLGLLPNP